MHLTLTLPLQTSSNACHRFSHKNADNSGQGRLTDEGWVCISHLHCYGLHWHSFLSHLAVQGLWSHLPPHAQPPCPGQQPPCSAPLPSPPAQPSCPAPLPSPLAQWLTETLVKNLVEIWWTRFSSNFCLEIDCKNSVQNSVQQIRPQF